jgi:hypothetical protein
MLNKVSKCQGSANDSCLSGFVRCYAFRSSLRRLLVQVTRQNLTMGHAFVRPGDFGESSP